MDLNRRLEVIRRQHRALMERAERCTRASERRVEAMRTAVVAHRHEWVSRRITELLRARGVEVVGATSVGADVVGWAAAEQPDLVVVSDALAMLSGEEAVRQIRRYCPSTIIAVHAGASGCERRLLEAGADAVHAGTARIDAALDEALRLALQPK